MRVVHVAAGVICRGDAVLVAQRGYGDMAGLWEFPGGKVESGESAADACARELAEELCIAVTDLRSCYTVEYDYEDFHLSMECFFCRLADEEAEIAPSDRQRDVRWVPRGELAELAWMPADVEFAASLAEMGAGAEDATAKAGAEGEPGGEAAPTSGPKRKTPSKPKARRGKARPKRPRTLIEQLDTDGLSEGEAELVRRREAVRRSMKGNVRADTRPELLVRRHLRAAGLTGYRLQWKKAPGRPDIAFPGRKVAIFVNGCFWHRCPHCNPSVPKRNVEFWEAKFARNVARDKKALTELEELGWRAIVIWECELKKEKLAETMERVVKEVRAAG